MAPSEPERRGTNPADERERLRVLVDQIGRLLADCPGERRGGLHDLAIRWVGDLGVNADRRSDSGRATPSQTSGATVLLGYGAMIVPVGLLVATVLPLGLVLSAVGLGMIVLAAAWALVARLKRPRGAASC